MTRRVVLLGVGFLFLAGCSGSGNEADSENKAAIATVAFEGDEGTLAGDIRGVVVDEEEVVVPGASVGVLELNLVATTDDTGAFAFLGVPVGTYTLYATKAGYDTTGHSVSVVEGETAEPVIILARLPSEDPWHETATYAGHLEWGVRVTPAVGGVADGDIIYKWETTEISTVLENLVVELHWQGTQALAKGMRMRVEIDGRDNNVPKSFAILEGPNPIISTVNATTIDAVIATGDVNCPEDKVCKMQWRVFTGTGNTGLDADVGVMLDQTFTGYVTMFYRMTAPPDFSAASG